MLVNFILGVIYLVGELVVLLFIVLLLEVLLFLLMKLLALSLRVPLLGEDFLLLALAHIHCHLDPSLLLVLCLTSK